VISGGHEGYNGDPYQYRGGEASINQIASSRSTRDQKKKERKAKKKEESETANKVPNPTTQSQHQLGVASRGYLADGDGVNCPPQDWLVHKVILLGHSLAKEI
jgi:hypothetical protein